MLELRELVFRIAEILKEYDSTHPEQHYRNNVYFNAGIGPFRETALVIHIAEQLAKQGIVARTRRTPADLAIQAEHGTDEWALEFKIVRPYGDNGKPAENWSRRLLHPYQGNASLIGDAIKLGGLEGYAQKGLIAIAFEHDSPKISLDPLLRSFELISTEILNVPLGARIEERRAGLVHPHHQVLRCIAWQLEEQNQ